MEGGNSFSGCHDMIALLENSNNSIWTPSSSSFPENMVNFDQEPQQGRRASPKRGRRHGGPFARASDGEDTGGEESDAYPNYHPEKKRRLKSEQVEYLEKSFEVENKLEPERKVQLAQQLGLQPRQVAIWFQNRRARYKTKQIEKEFDSLKASYDSLKIDYDSLNNEKENLKIEVELLKKKLTQKEGKEIDSNPDNILHNVEGVIPNTETHEKVHKFGSGCVVMPSNKQVEDASSAKSDVLDSESPHCADGNQTCALIEASSTLMRDSEQQSDFSSEDEEHLMMSKSLLLPQTPPTFNNFLKVADDENYDPNIANTCNFSLVDDQPFWSWLY